jgi:RNA polymerase sigma-70 factor (ECF subfamily)
MAEGLLGRARAGDGDAFAALVEPYQAELRAHCYRILGSVQDAEDALQETLMAAWRALGRFEERSSLRSWLYRIATNKCLNALRGARPRLAPEPSSPMPAPTRLSEPLWVEPYPDVLLGEVPDAAPGPEARYEAREAISLAFVAAVQRLPPMQRAALVLRDVLGFRAAEAAGILDVSVDSINGLLKRARASVGGGAPAGAPGAGPDGTAPRAPLPASAREREITAQFADAYERGDVAAIVALLTEDVTLTMPPLPFVYQGRDAVGHFLALICVASPMRLVPTRANGQPAFGCYLRDSAAPVARAHGLIVLTLRGAGSALRITEITRFLDCSFLPAFGLPRTLPD